MIYVIGNKDPINLIYIISNNLINNNMVNYKVDEKNRKVTCVLLEKNPDGGFYKSVGVAICSPNDEFNPEVGKEIAFLRARINESATSIGSLYETRRRVHNYVHSVDTMLDGRIAKHRKALSKAKEELAKLSERLQ